MLIDGEKSELLVTDIIEFLHHIKQIKPNVSIKNEPVQANDEYKQYRLTNPWTMTYGIKSGVCQL